ncbi:MATH and LRR domain-containing protein PFE0570w-like [Sitodiplosis mosellana]|uniref:MATH and LRR domain-containing protein PFE0570w-like n=1 Tax=Sitodiplosis mosellana TaxID=263140 RepID=UPI00244427E8|nr:MATH and LRR domain-containing protein PFE0570w-like [Sitodiplosis mosellana]
MSDLDENLTSILSSLIDTDGIEAPNTGELPDNSSFTDSRLDFDNLASCITGNDASLHQDSDENVSSLLESHLNELSQVENSTDITDSTAENLDDVTPFDLDKPIESLLETTSAEFISQECPETQNSLTEKVLNSQIISTTLNSPLNETEEIFEDAYHRSSNGNSNGKDNIDSTSQSNIEYNSPSSQSHGAFNAESNEIQTLNELNEIETSQIPDIFEPNSDVENQGAENQSCSGEEGPCEMITADEIVSEVSSKDAISKNEVKKRRRILVYNDGNSGGSELEEERERLLQSKSPTPSNHSAELGENENQIDQFNNEDSNHLYNNYIRDPNEKPGPKSKKQSTHLYNALKAKALLESAIVIPARKKKKKRVIDSDDEYSDSALNQPIASVDDIGLISEDNNIQSLFNVSIEFEQNSSTVYVKKEYDADLKPIISKLCLKNELDDERAKDDVVIEPAFIKVEPLCRTTTQVKIEKHNANNNRRSHKRKEPKDIFGISLNAPYVDSSSDEDYFLANSTSSRRHQHNHTQHWGNKMYLANQRKQKGHIPDDVYFNAKVPLHVLYSYDESSSDDEKNEFPVMHSVQSQKTFIQPTKRTLNKMPPVHKIISRPLYGKSTSGKIASKQPDRPAKQKNSQPASKPTVFEQLDKLKRLLRASGIKKNLNELLKGSKTFQERCDRIRSLLHRNGIEGEPTIAKCRRLKKQLKLKEEIAGLDPNVIIESKQDEGRPKRSTRMATRRNYVFDEPTETKNQQQLQLQPMAKIEDTSTLQLLQNMKEFIDSDSEYEAEEHNQSSNNIDPANMVETIISTNDIDAPPDQILTIAQSTQELHPVETAVEMTPVNPQCTITLQPL